MSELQETITLDGIKFPLAAAGLYEQTKGIVTAFARIWHDRVEGPSPTPQDIAELSSAIVCRMLDIELELGDLP